MTTTTTITTPLKTGLVLGLFLAGLMGASGALAEKPEWAGGGKNGNGKAEPREMQGRPAPAEGPGRAKPARDNGQDQNRPSTNSAKSARQAPQGSVKVGGYFGDTQRTAVRTYYGEQYKGGRCPPGLAKKNNGCMPPGQARKWAVGQALPRDVVYYSVPQSVIIQLGAPPPAHKYVRVAADILLIAIGTSLVVDAIQDIGRL